MMRRCTRNQKTRFIPCISGKDERGSNFRGTTLLQPTARLSTALHFAVTGAPDTVLLTLMRVLPCDSWATSTHFSRAGFQPMTCTLWHEGMGVLIPIKVSTIELCESYRVHKGSSIGSSLDVRQLFGDKTIAQLVNIHAANVTCFAFQVNPAINPEHNAAIVVFKNFFCFNRSLC
jgi:hypothetical protein